MFNLIKKLFSKKTVVPLTPVSHQHTWDFQYQTGKPTDGKSSVYKCGCGNWAVRHYGSNEYHILK